MARIESISKKTGPRVPGCASAAIVIFLGLFCAVGLTVGVTLSGIPIYRALQAQSWQATRCEVVSSRLVEGDESFSAEINYRYRIGAREYRADRYDFVPGTTSGGPPAHQLVAAYPAGRTFECYVDPADPTAAVIDRGISPAYFSGLLFAVPFTLFPGVMMLVWLHIARKMRAAHAEAAIPLRARPATQPAADRGLTPDAGATGPLVLKPSASPAAKLVGVVIACLFWNGITGLFTYFEVTGFAEGGAEWFMAIFLIPFQLIGLALIVAVPYQILALANPRPTITLSQRSVPVGGSVALEWQLSGAASRVSMLRLTLEGREEARYRRGTDTCTDTNVFYTAPIAEVSDTMGVGRGSATVRIPADTMHTFTADSNKIVWALKVKGDINRWPDIDESFELTVRAR